MSICAIHQPNFFPWTGYFDKIRRADIFIFLDDVAYPKSGSGSGSWCNRVKFNCSGKQTWQGLPIQKQSGVQLIRDVQFSEKDYHLNKFKKTLAHNYKKAAYFEEVIEKINPLIDFETNNLAEYNIHAITELSRMLGYQTRFIRQSELKHHLKSTALLVELIQQVGADSYLCGNGAEGYQEDLLFEENNIQLIYQTYHPLQDERWSIKDELECGLSILDRLFHEGLQSH